jgi:hypothetical protein
MGGGKIVLRSLENNGNLKFLKLGQNLKKIIYDFFIFANNSFS